jgi:hypothetical protein
MLFFQKIKDLLRSITRITLAIFIAITGSAIVIFVGVKLFQVYEESRDQELAVAKEWTNDIKDNLKVVINTKTKYQEKSLLYKIEVEGYTSFFSSPKNLDKHLSIFFYDKDGFTIARRDYELEKFSRVVDKEGGFKGLRLEDRVDLSSDEYRRINSLKFGWNIETKISSVSPKQEGARPTANLSSATDHCAPGLTKTERLSRLASKGPVREVGYETFGAASHRISFIGHSISSCW